MTADPGIHGLTLVELARAYFKLRAAADAAFKANDGGRCVGAAAQADRVVARFRLESGAENTDEAVKRMRELRNLHQLT